MNWASLTADLSFSFDWPGHRRSSSCCAIGWIMMISYAVVTRVEPRWIESIAYNLRNGILGLVMLYVGVTLYDRAKRTVHYRLIGWHPDERNVSLLVGPQVQQTLHIFFTEPEHSITCSNLVGLLRGGAGNGNEALQQCERCLTEQWTASQCSTYRNLKNRVVDIKKYLELLQIGSLVPVSQIPYRTYHIIEVSKNGRRQCEECGTVRYVFLCTSGS